MDEAFYLRGVVPTRTIAVDNVCLTWVTNKNDNNPKMFPSEHPHPPFFKGLVCKLTPEKILGPIQVELKLFRIRIEMPLDEPERLRVLRSWVN